MSETTEQLQEPLAARPPITAADQAFAAASVPSPVGAEANSNAQAGVGGLQVNSQATASVGAPAAMATKPAPSNWFTRHPRFTKEPVSNLAYQFFRSMMATIPYGLGMAAVHHLFGVASRAGVKAGLTEVGQKKFYDVMTAKTPFNGVTGGMAGGGAGAVKALDVVSAAERKLLYKDGAKALAGRNLMRLSNSPINIALQIGLSFSMFRFVGSIIKGVRDKIVDDKNTPEDTVRETNNWWKNAKDIMKTNWKAEPIGTFWAALTLGFIGSLVHQTTPYQKMPGEKLMGAVKRVLSRPAKLFQNGMIWAISYSTFFEVDERIQKDVKIRQGTWKGEPNSLLNAPNNEVGSPPSAENGRAKGEDDHSQNFGFMTHDPGLPRLLFRRLLPVAVGITGYAVMKRSGYVVAGGQMAPILPELTGKMNHLKHFGVNAWREGLATGTFGILWAATDAWGTAYDRFFQKLQNKDTQKPVTEHQQQKYSDLLERVNAKEASAGRAA